jgi:xanthine dehydrogenase accessory factor
MYPLATCVTGWLADGREVVIGRVIETRGFSSREPAAAFALTPGEPIVGDVASGAADRALSELLVGGALRESRVLEVTITDGEAVEAGLSCGGTARILVQPARDLDPRLWLLLAAEQPCVLVSSLDSAVPTGVFTPDEVADPDIGNVAHTGTSRTSVVASPDGEKIVTALWPTPRIVVLGGGSIATALASLAELLGWQCQIVEDASAATTAAGLRRGDALVVLSHDVETAGPVLVAAFGTPVSYIGGLGSRRTQAVRREWLLGAAVDPAALDRVHGPAGLDIGAVTPPEIALSIMAEALAARTGASAAPLTQRTGPIHRG